MDSCFAVISNNNYSPDPNDDIMDSLFHQYERVIVESLITSFGLDFLIKDQHGGDVDTINNVRKMDSDSKLTYKNKANEISYQNRGEYDKAKYHNSTQYNNIKAENIRKKEEGKLKDAYTGKAFSRNAEVDLDHVISAKEIHEDRGRCLAGIKGIDLANRPENLKPTDHSINRSMQEKSIEEFCQYLIETEPHRAAELTRLRNKSDLTDDEQKLLHKYEQQASINQEQMKSYDTAARKSNNAVIAQTYYSSKAFRHDTLKAASTVGIQMGIRQAVGLIFTEVWFCVRDEFDHVSTPIQMDKFLTAIGNGIKQGFSNAKDKYGELLEKFKDGAVAGILSSLTTTLCNIFFTTAKNIVRLLRQSYASLVEASKILFLNPDNLLFGERMRAASKIIATGASVVLGTVVSDVIGKTGITTIPVLANIVPTFCGTFVTGILTCSLLHYLDRSERMNRLVSILNTVPSMSAELDFYRQQAIYFENYAAELMQIDLEKFKEETTVYSTLAKELETAKDETALNHMLKNAYQTLGIEIPWGDDFNVFMNDKSQTLVFE